MTDAQSILSPAAYNAYRRDQVERLRADRAVHQRATITDPIAWIETDFYIPELNGPIRLAPYQRAVLREAYRTDASGKFLYDFVLWSDVKKSAKSSIAAAVVLERAMRLKWGSAKIVANDLKQADSRVFFYLRRAIELNPRLAELATIRNYKITLANKTTIEAIPVDPDGEAGGNDDLIEFTELHAFNSKAALKLWTEMTISPMKYGYSQRWADTYAGNSGESAILEPLYEQLVKPENLLDVGIPGLEVYAKVKVLCLWNTTPRLEWQTNDYYASEAITLTPSEFQRVHRNQWTTSENVFVPGEWWDACQDEMPPLPVNAPLVVALDAAVSGDCFGIVAVSRVGDKVYKRYERAWMPPRNGKIEYSNVDDPDDVNYPEGEIRRLAREYNVVEFAYDPYQLHDMATRLTHLSIGWFRPFPQGQDRLIADKQLYDDIRDRRFVHDGDGVLSQHVKNANAKTEGDNKLRIVKRAEHLKIDCAVCASMANSEARRLRLG